MDCLFCKIINREIPADIVYEDDDVLAFNDIDPKAPIHMLVVPKKHIATLNDIEEGDLAWWGACSTPPRICQGAGVRRRWLSGGDELQ